jgi:hypothetical protein
MMRIGGSCWYAIIAAGLVVSMGIPTQAEAVVFTAKIIGVAIPPNCSVFSNWSGIGWPLLYNRNAPTATNSGPVSRVAYQEMSSTFITAKPSAQNHSMFIDYGATTARAFSVLPNFSWQVPSIYHYDMSFEGRLPRWIG